MSLCFFFKVILYLKIEKDEIKGLGNKRFECSIYCFERIFFWNYYFILYIVCREYFYGVVLYVLFIFFESLMLIYVI